MPPMMRANLHVVFMRGWCVYSLSVRQCLRSVNHEQFPMQVTQNSKHNKWLEILVGENLPPKVLWRFIGMRIEEDNREHRLAQRRQRRQYSDHKHVQRQRQDKLMKRGKTDCRRFNWKATEDQEDQPTVEVYRQNYLLRCSDRQQELHDLYNARQEYLSNGLRTADTPLHREQQWVLH